MGILNEIQQMMGEIQCEPENFTGRIIFMSMFNDVAWRENGNTEQCIQNSHRVSKYARRMSLRSLVILGTWIRKGTKTCSDKLDGNCGRTAEIIILQVTAESGHPIFLASSAFKRGDLGSKGHGKKSTQINDNEGTIEMPLRTVISVNQLSIYGALADLCKELNKNHPKIQVKIHPKIQKGQEHFTQKNYWRRDSYTENTRCL